MMMEFSGLVWAVPLLLFVGVIISFTFNSSEQTMRVNICLAFVSFILSLLVTVERVFNNSADYGYYVDWFVVDHFYYRIGYEVNHTSAFFLVLITGINVINLFIALQQKDKKSASTYSFLNLISGLLAAIVISDNILTYYILSFCLSVSVFLKLANVSIIGMVHILRVYSKTFIIGHLLFLCALILIFYYQPNHAVEFNVIDSSLSMQPDLLLMDAEWIIGLLLVISTIFISTVLIPFEKQLREQPINVLVTIYTITFVRILMPTYMLIRFESLIRIDPLIETCVIVLGVVLLVLSCIKLLRKRSIADILLNMSNAMLGMLYMMYGLEAKVMLSALVLIYLSVFLLLLLLVIVNKKPVFYLIAKACTSIILLFPFIMCISASHIYSLNISTDVSYLNVMVWIGMAVYSLIIFMSIMGLNRDKFGPISVELKSNMLNYFIMVVVVLTLIVAVSLSWSEQFILLESAKFSINFDKQFWINLFIMVACMGVGLLATLLIKKTKQYYRPIDEGKIGHELNYITPLKLRVVGVVNGLELFWSNLLEHKLPYVFKKTESYVSQRITSHTMKIMGVWVISIVIAMILVIVRG